MKIEFGKRYRDRFNGVWHSAVELNNGGWRLTSPSGAVCVFTAGGVNDLYDLVAEIPLDVEEADATHLAQQDVFTPEVAAKYAGVAPQVVNLATATPLNDMILFSLIVGGHTESFEISRSAAASFAGRIAEALAK